MSRMGPEPGRSSRPRGWRISTAASTGTRTAWVAPARGASAVTACHARWSATRAACRAAHLGVDEDAEPVRNLLAAGPAASPPGLLPRRPRPAPPVHGRRARCRRCYVRCRLFRVRRPHSVVGPPASGRAAVKAVVVVIGGAHVLRLRHLLPLIVFLLVPLASVPPQVALPRAGRVLVVRVRGAVVVGGRYLLLRRRPARPRAAGHVGLARGRRAASRRAHAGHPVRGPLARAAHSPVHLAEAPHARRSGLVAAWFGGDGRGGVGAVEELQLPLLVHDARGQEGRAVLCVRQRVEVQALLRRKGPRLASGPGRIRPQAAVEPAGDACAWGGVGEAAPSGRA